MRVTIKDIARALGVSPSTVTRALAGSSRIGADTARRVRAQAEVMGYVADSSARAMQKGRSALVGLLLPDIENSSYAAMARTAAEHCRLRGFQLVLSLTEDDPAREEAQVRELVSVRCAGILLVPTGELRQASGRMLAAVPTVQLVRRSDHLAADGYGIDDRKALATACGYLLDLGHRKVGLLVGDASVDTARARRAGFLDAFALRGLAVDETLIRSGPPRTQHGAEATMALLRGAAAPTAIVAAGSALTEGMLDAVGELYGATAPPVSLLGFGDSPAFRWWGGEGLTAVSLPVARIVAAACARLFERIDAPAESRPAVTLSTFETGIVLRGSARPPLAIR